MGFRPRSRREALLYELSLYSGTRLTADELTDDLGAEQIAEMVLRREGLDPVMERKQCERVTRIVEDWLFDPRGRGAGSGLPR